MEWSHLFLFHFLCSGAARRSSLPPSIAWPCAQLRVRTVRYISSQRRYFRPVRDALLYSACCTSHYLTSGCRAGVCFIHDPHGDRHKMKDGSPWSVKEIQEMLYGPSLCKGDRSCMLSANPWQCAVVTGTPSSQSRLFLTWYHVTLTPVYASDFGFPRCQRRIHTCGSSAQDVPWPQPLCRPSAISSHELASRGKCQRRNY